MKQIIERDYNLFGYHIHIRCEPKEFDQQRHQFSRLMDEDKIEEAGILLNQMKERWDQNGLDPEMIRMKTYYEFMTEPFVDEK